MMEHKMKVYRFLTEGEILQAGDEWGEVYNGDEVWHPVTWSIGDALSAGNGDTFRRPIARVTDELTHLRVDLATARADYAAALDTLRDATTALAECRAENARLMAEAAWIPVTERLPEKRKVVFLIDEDNDEYAIGRWNEAVDRWDILFSDYQFRRDFFTHWRTLPAHPAARVEPETDVAE